MIYVLLRARTCNLLSAVGSILFGGGAMIITEWIFQKTPLMDIANYGTYPALGTLPSVLPVLHPGPARPDGSRQPPPFSPRSGKHPGPFCSPGKGKIKLAQTVTASQLLTAMAWASVYSGPQLNGQLPEWIPRLTSIIIYALIFLTARWYEKDRGDSDRLLTPALVLDLLVFWPIIHLALTVTGGDTSPYKFLYLPYLITNSLKPYKLYGLAALLFSSISLASIGVRSVISGSCVFERDVIYIGTMIIVYWLLRHLLNGQGEMYSALKHQASVDGLTGLFNYRFAKAYLGRFGGPGGQEGFPGHNGPG